MRTIFTLTLIVILSIPDASHSQVVASWNFDNLTSVPISNTLTADSGSGTLYLKDGTHGTFSATSTPFNSSFAGVTFFTGVSGNALGIQGSANGNSGALVNNGQFMTLVTSSTGLSNVMLSFSSRINHASSSFNINKVQYSTTGLGGTFQDFSGNTFAPGTSFTTFSFDLSGVSALNNQSSIAFRITIDGADSPNSSIRFDNLQVTAVPEPGSMILVGATGLVAMGWRRLRRSRSGGKPTETTGSNS